MDFAHLKLACADLPKGRLNSGASVSVSIPASLFTRMVLMCYLLPALLMVVGAALGSVFVNQHPDLWALLGASSGLMLGCAALRLYDSRFCSPGLGEQPGTASHSSPVFLTES